jgi:hypothetical protein
MIGAFTTRGIRPRPFSQRFVALLMGATAFVGICAGAASAQSAHVAAAAPSVCSHVGPSSISAIVGFSVPAARQSTVHVPATKSNYEISAVDTTCTYGAETSLADIKKTVLLETAVESKALTAAEIAASFKKSEAEAHAVQFKIVSYSGLGVTAFYATESISGIYAQIIAGESGTHSFSAAVYSKTLSESKVAALAKLAEKL